MLKHPRYGTIRTKIRAGCPEIVDSVQAAALIAELEGRRIDELRQRTADLQDRLNAIRMMEVTKEDWRRDLAAYAQEGCVVDGLQALYKSPLFKDLPEDVLMGMVPHVEVDEAKGWEYLKGWPVSRRIRKRLWRSKAWVVNLYGGRGLKQDPVQSLNGQANIDTNTEVVVVNVEILLDGGWSVRGPAYKALMWAAMTSRIKAVIGTPPAKTYHTKAKERVSSQAQLRTKEEPYGITGLSPNEIFHVNKETALAARQVFLYLIAHACSKGKPVGWMLSNPGAQMRAAEAKQGVDLWQTPMMKEFFEVVGPLGVTSTTVEVVDEDTGNEHSVTISENLGIKECLKGEMVSSTSTTMPWKTLSAKLRRSMMTGMQTSGIASTRAWHPTGELRKLTAEQGWKLHVQRDHVPYRRDCEYCVMMMGTGKQHRRTKQKSAYVLSVDVWTLEAPCESRAKIPMEGGTATSWQPPTQSPGSLIRSRKRNRTRPTLRQSSTTSQTSSRRR